MKAVGRLGHALSDVEASYEKIVGLKKANVGGSDVWPACRMAVSIDVIQQVGIRRVVDLTEAFSRDVNAEAFAPVWVGSRALIEVAAVMYDVTERAQACVKNATPDTFHACDTLIGKIYLGFKSMEWAYSEDITAKNVLTTVEKVSKKDPPVYREALERLGATVGKFMSLFELLSEGAHPNYVGMAESYQRPDLDTGVTALIDSPTKLDATRIGIPVDGAALALSLAISAVNDWQTVRDQFIALLPKFQPAPMPEPKPKLKVD